MLTNALMSRALRVGVSLLLGSLGSACWSSTVIAPAAANSAGSVGYGVMEHTLYAGVAAVTLTAVGVVAQTPWSELGDAGDSVWLVVDQQNLQYCLWITKGEAVCRRVSLGGGSLSDPIRIIDPVNLGVARKVISAYNPETGRVESKSDRFLVRAVDAKEFTKDRAIWVLSGTMEEMFRCSANELGVPECKRVKL